MSTPAAPPGAEAPAGPPGARDRLIVALDHPTLAAALAQVDALGELVARYKVGLELFSAAGPTAVAALVERGKRVFLDLKLHDIPETAHRAARAAAAQGIDLLTVHAAGGRAMMARAVEGARAAAPYQRPKVLAVTVLTSLERRDLQEVGSDLAVDELVVRRARLAEGAGCDGVIASPREVAALRMSVREGFLIVTPGVRPTGAANEPAGDDQKRVATAREARAAGADAVVVGRPIRNAEDPRAVARALLDELG
jgi:orotidine-5'-phosphate decarboxylase